MNQRVNANLPGQCPWNKLNVNVIKLEDDAPGVVLLGQQNGIKVVQAACLLPKLQKSLCTGQLDDCGCTSDFISSDKFVQLNSQIGNTVGFFTYEIDVKGEVISQLFNKTIVSTAMCAKKGETKIGFTLDSDYITQKESGKILKNPIDDALFINYDNQGNYGIWRGVDQLLLN